MTKAGRSTLAVAISLLLVLSLPKLTWAQKPVAYGTWSGYATYTETDYGASGSVIGGFSGGGFSNLTVDIFSSDFSPGFYATVSGPPGFNSFYPYNLLSFGPQSASGFTADFGEAGFDANFDVTYGSILPDGQFDNTGGFAVADYSGNTFFGFGEPSIAWFATFNSNSVPEPSAMVPMAIGTVMVVTSVVVRRRRARMRLERASAAGGLE
jgi:hypothetical protein